jgi:hypothetical protein
MTAKIFFAAQCFKHSDPTEEKRPSAGRFFVLNDESPYFSVFIAGHGG